MKELEKILSRVRKACQTYSMIAPGDRIAVGLSGGKDSAALLYALAAMRRFYPTPYEVLGISVDLGFPGSEGLFDSTAAFCSSLGVEYRIVKTQIAQIVFDERKEKNPCSLCANMRRGALINEAEAAGVTKIALGHHLDDAVETFMMSLMHNGKLSCFSPVTVYEDRGISVIRPLIYTRETEIRAAVKAGNFPVVKSPCPEDGNTERAEMKTYLREFDREHRGLYDRILGAMERGEIDGWKKFI